jgi:hypothetical protein
MIRAQLIELTPDSDTCRGRPVVEQPFTSRWQSSKLPSMAIA